MCGPSNSSSSALSRDRGFGFHSVSERAGTAADDPEPGRGGSSDQCQRQAVPTSATDDGVRDWHAPLASSSPKVSDIDSKRMIVRVVQGKRSKDRDLPLNPELAGDPPRVLGVGESQKKYSVPQRRRAQRAGRAAIR